MREKNGKNKFTKDKNLLYVSVACVAVGVVLLSTILAVAFTGNENEQLENPPVNEDVSGDIDGDQTVGGEQTPDADENGGEQATTTPEGFVLPIQSASATNGFGFFYNQTLNNYYEHQGIDFSANAGTVVVSVDDGVVESVYTADVLSGTEIVISHDNGLKSVYRFVTQVDGLKAGDKVSKGQTIATVAEPNGSEYKDGAHLHFEVIENGKNVDPVSYLSLEEK